MTISMTQRWAAITAVVMAAVLAAGWFLLISPKRADAAKIQAQAAAQKATNEGLRQQLELLKAQSLDLPKQKAKLARLRSQIPDNPALPTLVRSLTKSAREVGVQMTALSPTTPILSAAGAPAVTVLPSTESTSTDAAAGDSNTTDPAPPVPAAPAVAAADPLYEVPLTLEVKGSYFELEQFVNKLEGHQRSFLVTGFTVTEALDGGPSGGSTTESGSPDDLQLSINGKVFMSPVTAQVAATPTTAIAGSTAPAN